MNDEKYISEERNMISELIAGIDDLWILNQIRKFIVNMTSGKERKVLRNKERRHSETDSRGIVK